MDKLRGFTLIEAMLVVAIIAVLSSVAIPTYQDYRIRARVAEGLNMAASAKTAVTETRQSLGNFPNNNVAAGLPATINSTMVSGISVSAGGVITITYDNTQLGTGTEGDSTITFVPTFANGTVSWDCSGGSMAAQFRPGECRE